MVLQLTRGTSWAFESPPFEEYPGGPAVLPVDPSSYPQFVITDPEGTIVQQGVAKPLTDRVYTSHFHVPLGSLLSYPGSPWRISWVLVSASNRQIEASLDFEVVDTIDVTEDERAYTYIVRLNRGERLFFRTMQRPEELSVEVVDPSENVVFSADRRANEGIPAQSGEIQEVVEGSQYIYYIDLPNFTNPYEYHAIWDWRQTTVSPLETNMQVLRVVPQGIWKWFTPLRMMIDKLQKKQGRPHAYTDADIYEYLLRGVDIVNSKAPATSWTLTQFPHFCGADSLLLAGAALWALRAQYIMEGELQFCFAKGTYVSTPEGLLPIEKLVGELPPGLHKKAIDLYTPDGIQTTEYVYVSEPKDTKKIVTKNGYEVTCTPNEPLLTLQPDLTLVWKKVEDLSPGDHVAISKQSQVINNTPDLGWAADDALSSRQEDRAKNNPRLPRRMTRDLARIMGYLVAEGTFSSYKTIFTNSNRVFLEDFEKRAQNLFGEEIIDRESMGPSKIGSENIENITIKGAIIARYLYNCGLQARIAPRKEVPWCIMEAPEEFVAEFFKGFFAGDGSISENNKREYATASLLQLSSSEKLLHQMQTLLMRLGMVSRREHNCFSEKGEELSHTLSKVTTQLHDLGYGKRTSSFQHILKAIRELRDDGVPIYIDSEGACRLSITGPSCDLYREKVGFIGEKCIEVGATKRYPQRESLPLFIQESLKKEIEEIRSFYKISKGWITKKDGRKERVVLSLRRSGIDPSALRVQYKHLENYLEETQSYLEELAPLFLKKIQTLLQYRFQYEEIESITDAGVQTTYDVCLPETDSPLSHAFIANGFVAHNSYGGQTLSLDLDHTGTYSEAASMWQQWLDDNARSSKLCVIRRGGNTTVGLRPYGINASTISRPMRGYDNFGGGARTLLALIDV